ncbi:MAG: hypothetical protein M1376_10825 [Planctomycetes bacterium]|nr:hypothetical protein [Planctomycetota bacterium]
MNDEQQDIDTKASTTADVPEPTPLERALTGFAEDFAALAEARQQRDRVIRAKRIWADRQDNLQDQREAAAGKLRDAITAGESVGGISRAARDVTALSDRIEQTGVVRELMADGDREIAWVQEVERRVGKRIEVYLAELNLVVGEEIVELCRAAAARYAEHRKMMDAIISQVRAKYGLRVQGVSREPNFHLTRFRADHPILAFRTALRHGNIQWLINREGERKITTAPTKSQPAPALTPAAVGDGTEPALEADPAPHAITNNEPTTEIESCGQAGETSPAGSQCQGDLQWQRA